MKIIRILLIALILSASVIAGIALIRYWQDEQVVTDYESCVAAGNPIRESYPAVCVTPDGKSYTQPVTDDITGQ